jgi:CheY-like chemotaxis protein
VIATTKLPTIRATVFIVTSSGALVSISALVGHTLRILLVDDNYIQSATRRAILEGAGRSVSIAPQGQEALKFLSEPDPADPIVLIITDHLMPVMNGPEFVAEVRRRGMTLPIIVLSGLPDAETAYEGLDVVFRLKPCDPAMLILIVQDLLGECMRRSA